MLDASMESGASAFEFAFNNKTFSDRVLLLELDDTSPCGFEDELRELEATEAFEEASNGPQRKKRRKGRGDAHGASTSTSNKGVAEGVTLSIKTGPDGVARKELYVCSAILASKSEFFRQMFSNGMKESEEKELIIKLAANEEDAFIDAVRFIFYGHVASKSVPDLIRLILIADRFQISSCIQAACDALAGGSLQAQNASPWGVVKCLLALPDSVRTHKTVSELLDKAQQKMSEYYKDFQARARQPGGLSELSVAGLQMVLASHDLEVESEAHVFDAVRAWVRARFEDADGRAAAMAQLAPHVRFPWIPPEKLETYVGMDEMQSDTCQKLLMEALLFRSLPKDGRARLMQSAGDDKRFVRRGSTLPVERLPSWFCWEDAQAFLVLLPESSLPDGPDGASIFTEEFLFEGNPYRLEFLRPAAASQDLGAFLHVLKKVPRSQLPAMKVECLTFESAGGNVLDHSDWSRDTCAPPASGPLDRYGSDDILMTRSGLAFSFPTDEEDFPQIFRGKGPERAASIMVTLGRSG